jgi:hypothetical protein
MVNEAFKKNVVYSNNTLENFITVALNAVDNNFSDANNNF